MDFDIQDFPIGLLALHNATARELTGVTAQQLEELGVEVPTRATARVITKKEFKDLNSKVQRMMANMRDHGEEMEIDHGREQFEAHGSEPTAEDLQPLIVHCEHHRTNCSERDEDGDE